MDTSLVTVMEEAVVVAEEDAIDVMTVVVDVEIWNVTTVRNSRLSLKYKI